MKSRATITLSKSNETKITIIVAHKNVSYTNAMFYSHFIKKKKEKLIRIHLKINRKYLKNKPITEEATRKNCAILILLCLCLSQWEKDVTVCVCVKF